MEDGEGLLGATGQIVFLPGDGGSAEGLRGSLYDSEGNLFLNVSTLRENIKVEGGFVQNFNEPSDNSVRLHVKELTDVNYPTSGSTAGKSFHTFGTYADQITPTLNLGSNSGTPEIIEFRDIKSPKADVSSGFGFPMILVHVATAQAILMVTVTLALIMFQRHTVILLVETLNLKQHV